MKDITANMHEAISDAAYEITEMAIDAADEKRLTRLVSRVLADVYGGKPSTFRAAIEDAIDDRGYEYMGIPVHRFDIDFPGGRVSIDASDAGSECFYAIRRALGTTGLSELMPGPSLGPDGVISTRFEEV